ncbi:hypothetical protein [Clostridium perfringens]|uniref:hypothetical protein n=1 Tax=Clostridium perfringens TaxID=1502 RepID=UPI00096AC2E5|nr:hypothetical protein [Clostridium perfringens]
MKIKNRVITIEIEDDDILNKNLKSDLFELLDKFPFESEVMIDASNLENDELVSLVVDMFYERKRINHHPKRINYKRAYREYHLFE